MPSHKTKSVQIDAALASVLIADFAKPNKLPKWAINEDQLPWPGMMTAFETYYGQSWFDRDWRGETAIWAAAWKAAKTHNAGVKAAAGGSPATEGSEP